MIQRVLNESSTKVSFKDNPDGTLKGASGKNKVIASGEAAQVVINGQPYGGMGGVTVDVIANPKYEKSVDSYARVPVRSNNLLRIRYSVLDDFESTRYLIVENHLDGGDITFSWNEEDKPAGNDGAFWMNFLVNRILKELDLDDIDMLMYIITRTIIKNVVKKNPQLNRYRVR